MKARPTRAALASLAQGARPLLALRWVRVVLVLGGLAVLLRLTLGLLLMFAIDAGIRSRGLECNWEDLDLSILSGRGEVRYLELAPRSDIGPHEPIVVVEYAVFDLELLPLFVGKLRVRRLEIDGAEVSITRDPDGIWSLARYLHATTESEPESTPIAEKGSAAPTGERAPIVLAPSFSVEALRLQDVNVNVSDRTSEPPGERAFHLDAEVASLWSPDRPTRYSMTVTSDRILDGAHVEGSAEWKPDHLALDLRAQLGGLRPQEIAPYLQELGILPACRSIRGRLAVHVEAAVIGPSRDAVRANVEVTDASLTADEKESLALDRASIEVSSLSSAGASIPRVEIEGLRAQASLERAETVRIAGLDVSTAPPSPGRSSFFESLTDFLAFWNRRDMPAWAALLLRDDPRAFPWSLDVLSLRRAEVRLVDDRVEPAAEFPVLVDEIEVRDLVHSRGAHPPGARKIPVHVSVSVPGTAESIQIAGSVAPFVPDRSIDLAVEVDGLGFEAMAGYLRSAGLEDSGQAGGLRLRLVGEATTDAGGATDGRLELEESLTLGGQEASQLGRVRARDLRLDPVNELVCVGDIELSGTRILLARDPSRHLVAFGMRTLGLGAAPAQPKTAPSASSAAVANQVSVARLPLVQIGRIAWTDSHLSFLDSAQDPPLRLAVEPFGFELTGLSFGGDAGTVEPPGKLHARAVAAGLFDELSLDGEIRTKLGGVDLEAKLALAGSGIRGTLLAPYLKSLGLETALEDGRAKLHVEAALHQAGGWRASLGLRDGELTDGPSSIAKLAEFSVEDVTDSADGLSIGRVSIVEPYLRIVRLKENAIRAGGLRLVGATADALSAKPSAKSGPEPSDVRAPPSPLTFPELPRLRLREFGLRGARLSFRDESVDPPVDADVLFDASGKNLSTTGERGSIGATMRIPGSLESFAAEGGLVAGPTNVRIEGSLDVKGVKNGPLARLLPPGTSLTLSDGRFSGGGAVEIGAATGGGIRARVEAKDLLWRDATSEPTFACKLASLAIPRIDPAAGVLEIGPAEVEGLALDAQKDAEGALRFLGLRIDGSRRAPPASAPQAPAPQAPATESSESGLGFTQIRLAGDLAFALERFRFSDASLGEGARPIELGASLRVPGPLDLLGDDRQSLPPIAWSAEASIRGLIERCRVEGSLRPFADDPQCTATLAADGVRTQGLLEFVPSLARRMHGDVEQGTLEGRFEAQCAVRRARPAEFGFGRPFGAEIRLDGLAFRDRPGGEVLAGVDAIAVDVEKVDLPHGIVHVKSVEVTRPRGLALRSGSSLSLVGLAIDLSPPTESAPSPSPPAPTSPVVAAEPQDPEPSTSDLRIDRLLVSGIGAELRDTTRDPVVVVPLAGLDVEAGPLTTRALREHVPFRFHSVVTGGVPTRVGAVAGVGGHAEAPIFDELVLAGDVSLRPEPSGWVQLSLSGLELPEAAALAPPQALDVQAGSLDLRVHANLKGNSGVRVQSTLVFTDLSLKEARGGPIESGLSLPVTLDAALFLLRNPAGEHRISAGFTVDSKGISGGQIATAATEAVAQVLGVALASAPLRLLGALVPKSGEKPRGPKAVREVRFAAGSSDLPLDTARALFDMKREFEVNPSLTMIVRDELGAGDVQRSELLANPSESDSLAVLARARQRKAELLRSRGEAVTRARALFAVGARDAAGASESLRTIDAELASVEDSLDGVLEILRSSSPRQVRKRTRAAALAIAQSRLDAVATVLRNGMEADAVSRLEVRDPRFDVSAPESGGRIVVELRER